MESRRHEPLHILLLRLQQAVLLTGRTAQSHKAQQHSDRRCVERVIAAALASQRQKAIRHHAAMLPEERLAQVAATVSHSSNRAGEVWQITLVQWSLACVD